MFIIISCSLLKFYYVFLVYIVKIWGDCHEFLPLIISQHCSQWQCTLISRNDDLGWLRLPRIQLRWILAMTTRRRDKQVQLMGDCHEKQLKLFFSQWRYTFFIFARHHEKTIKLKVLLFSWWSPVIMDYCFFICNFIIFIFSLLYLI